MSTIYISGYIDSTPFNYELRPSSVEATIKTFGEDIRGLDGTNTRYHRANKHEFKLSFENVREATVLTLKNIFINPAEYSYQHENGTKYTVFTEADSFSTTLSSNSVSLQGIKFYNLSIGLCEV